MDWRGAQPHQFYANFQRPFIEHATDGSKTRFLMSNDTDPYSRWDAAQCPEDEGPYRYGTNGRTSQPRSDQRNGLNHTMRLDPAFRALVLSLPNESELARQMTSEGYIMRYTRPLCNSCSVRPSHIPWLNGCTTC